MGIKSLFDHTVSQSSIVEVGTIVMYTSINFPKGWLRCDGSSYSITDYPQLYAVLGVSVVPQLVGRAAIGQGFGSGLTNRVLGTQLGTENVTLTSVESGSGSHSHASTIATIDHAHTYLRNSGSSFMGLTGGGSSVNGSSISFTSSVTPTLTYTNVDTTAAAASAAHNNMQPSLPISFIIKAG
jgi:microcystin-dependent protein